MTNSDSSNLSTLDTAVSNPLIHSDGDGGVDKTSATQGRVHVDFPEQPPRLARYLRAWSNGTFHSAVVYSEQETGRGERILRGAYYGYDYDGTYRTGYFKIDTESGDSGLVPCNEAEYGDESPFFDTAMAVCRSFWTVPYGWELPQWSVLGLSLLNDGGFWEDEGEEGERILLFTDGYFDGNALREVSEDWRIAVGF